MKRQSPEGRHFFFISPEAPKDTERTGPALRPDFGRPNPSSRTSRLQSPWTTFVLTLVLGIPWTALSPTEARGTMPPSASNSRTEASPDARARPLALLLVSREDGQNAKALVDAVAGQLASLPVRFRAIWLDRFPDRLADQVRTAAQTAKRTSGRAVFWADLRSGRQIFLYLTNQAGSRTLVRTISPETTNQADRILATALVVESSMKALLSGGRIGLHRRVAMPPARPQRPSKEWLDIAMSYGLMPLSNEAATLNGARLELSLRILGFMRAYLAYRFLRSAAVTTEDVRLTLHSHPMEAGLSFRWRRGRLALGGEGGIWTDYVTWDVQPMRMGVWAVPPDSRWNVGATLLGRLSYSPFSGGAIFLDLGLDVPFLERRYTAQIAGETKEVTAPWPARPWFAVGLSLAPF